MQFYPTPHALTKQQHIKPYVYVMYLKVTVHSRTGHKGPEGSSGLALLFLKPRLYREVVGQRHALAILPPEKTRYPLYRRLGGPQGQSGRVRKISPTLGFDLRIIQPVASCYTD